MSKHQKSFQDRRDELRQALYRVKGAINRYKQTGEQAEIGTIAIELRGLLSGEALFISLSEEEGFPLDIHVRQINWKDIPADLQVTHAWSGYAVSLTAEGPYKRKVTLQEWIDTPIAKIEGSLITPKRLTNEIANQLGPAHYPTEISNTLLEMMQVYIGGVPSYVYALLPFAERIVELGERFLATY